MTGASSRLRHYAGRLGALALLAVSAIQAGQLLAQEAPAVGRAQYVAQMDAEFARLDADSNGIATAQEIAAQQAAAARAEALRQNRSVFDGLDADGNGALTPEEFAALANPAAIQTDPSPMLTSFDSDGDGAISLLEYRVTTQARFDSIDADRDGTISPVEMRSAGIIR